MALPTFIFNADAETPEQIAERKRRAAALLAAGQGGVATNVGQGIAQLGQALAGRIGMSSANKAERKRMAAARKLLMGIGVPGASPVASPVPAPDAGDALTGGAGSDMLAGGTAPPSNWLTYANQGAIRNKPVDDQLANALGFLPEMGVTMKVFSGGQDAKGKGGRRTGSTRHDHGKSADVFFEKDGKRLDWANPEHVPLFKDIVARARANGVTGFGAGPGYMQPGSMHVGFGAPAVWGAGGKGENAPDWLREAFNAKVQGRAMAQAQGQTQIVPASAPPPGAPMPEQPPQAPQMAPQPQVQPAGAPMPPQAQPGPMSPYQRQMGNAMDRGSAPEAVQRQMQGAPQGGQGGNILNNIFAGIGGGNQPAPEMAPAMAPEMAPAPGMEQPAPEQGAPQARLQRIWEAMFNPWVAETPGAMELLKTEYEREMARINPDPMADLERQYKEAQIEKMRADVQTAQAGGTTEYGLNPQFGVDADGNPVMIQVGKNGQAVQTKMPPDVKLSRDPIKMDAGTHFVLLDPVTRQPVGQIPKDLAGAEAQKEIGAASGKASAAASSDMAAAETALALLDSIEKDPNLDWGVGGTSMGNFIPGTPGRDFQTKVDQATSGAFLSAIQQMRGMGALSNAEGQTATQAVTRMNTSASKEEFLSALNDYRNIVKSGYAKAAARAGQPAPPQGNTKRLKFNPETGELE